MSQQVHMSGSVRGVLMWDDAQWEDHIRAFRNDDGSPMTKEQLQKFLLDELEQGHTSFQMNPDCDNHDFKLGCMGHEIEEEDNVTKQQD